MMEQDEELIRLLKENSVDIDKVMPIFLGDRQYYLDMMERFVKENEIEKLRECIENQQYELALNHAYNVKSLTGTLGLPDAYRVSESLCIHVREKNDTEVYKEISQIAESYEKVKTIFESVYHREY